MGRSIGDGLQLGIHDKTGENDGGEEERKTH
jgi:hypothetical protein